MEQWKVKYPGFLQIIVRVFPTKAAAVRWLRQVGKLNEATITKL